MRQNKKIGRRSRSALRPGSSLDLPVPRPAVGSALHQLPLGRWLCDATYSSASRQLAPTSTFPAFNHLHAGSRVQGLSNVHRTWLPRTRLQPLQFYPGTLDSTPRRQPLGDSPRRQPPGVQPRFGRLVRRVRAACLIRARNRLPALDYRARLKKVAPPAYPEATPRRVEVIWEE